MASTPIIGASPLTGHQSGYSRTVTTGSQSAPNRAETRSLAREQGRQSPRAAVVFGHRRDSTPANSPVYSDKYAASSTTVKMLTGPHSAKGRDADIDPVNTAAKEAKSPAKANSGRLEWTAVKGQRLKPHQRNNRRRPDVVGEKASVPQAPNNNASSRRMRWRSMRQKPCSYLSSFGFIHPASAGVSHPGF